MTRLDRFILTAVASGVSSSWPAADAVERFTERACAGGSLGTFPAHHLMPLVMANAGRLTKFGA